MMKQMLLILAATMSMASVAQAKGPYCFIKTDVLGKSAGYFQLSSVYLGESRFDTNLKKSDQPTMNIREAIADLKRRRREGSCPNKPTPELCILTRGGLYMGPSAERYEYVTSRGTPDLEKEIALEFKSLGLCSKIIGDPREF